MATSIHPSIPVLSPSFLYHPYIPSFQSKDFSFTCIHVHVHVYTCILYMYTFTSADKSLYINFMLFTNILPEAICCLEHSIFMWCC